MQDYRKLTVWRSAHAFTVQVFRFTKPLFSAEALVIVRQLQRAASSVPANIAEGCGRKTPIELARFLDIALGSMNEADYFILLAKDVGILSLQPYDRLTQEAVLVRKMLISLIQVVRLAELPEKLGSRAAESSVHSPNP